MFKKIGLLLLVLAVAGVGIYKLFFDGQDVATQLEDAKTIESYHMEGNMEVINGEDQRDFLVKVSYADIDGVDHYRVSMLDLGVNQEQLIIRNTKGVFVLTPALNQVYEFKGDWPVNTPKPYVYQSLLKVFEGKHEVRRLEDGFLVLSDVSYPNSPQWAKQEIKFSPTLRPAWVHIYDSQGTVRMKLTFSVVEVNNTFENDYFEVQANMTAALVDAAEITAVADDLPLLPAGVTVSATLKEQTVAQVNGDKVHILTYEGNQAFTVIQKLLQKGETTVTVKIDGNLYDVYGGVAYQTGDVVTYIYNGVEYRFYSDVLKVNELIDIANGMEIITTKP